MTTKLRKRDKDTENWRIFQNYNKLFWMQDFSLGDANKKLSLVVWLGMTLLIMW